MPNDLSSTPAPTPTLTDAKTEKATLERLILQLVQDYEERFGCLVAVISLDDKREVVGGPRRTYAARVTVNL